MPLLSNPTQGAPSCLNLILIKGMDKCRYRQIFRSLKSRRAHNIKAGRPPVKGTARPYRCITHIEVEYACSRRYSDIMARFKALNLKPSHIRNTP